MWGNTASVAGARRSPRWHLRGVGSTCSRRLVSSLQAAGRLTIHPRTGCFAQLDHSDMNN